MPFYEFLVETPKGKGAIKMMESCTLRDGRLATSRLVFNTPDLVALTPQ